jgi:hypothetical protein
MRSKPSLEAKAKRAKAQRWVVIICTCGTCVGVISNIFRYLCHILSFINIVSKYYLVGPGGKRRRMLLPLRPKLRGLKLKGECCLYALELGSPLTPYAIYITSYHT